jgi:hypothetical protein
MRRRIVRAFVRIWVPGGAMLALGGCALSDQQLQGILSSVITTVLETAATSVITAATADSAQP